MLLFSHLFSHFRVFAFVFKLHAFVLFLHLCFHLLIFLGLPCDFAHLYLVLGWEGFFESSCVFQFQSILQSMSITKYSGYTSVAHLTIGSKEELVYSSEMRNSSGELVDVIRKGNGSNLARFNDVRALMFQKEAGFWVINHEVKSNEMQILLVHDDSVTIAAVWSMALQ